MTKDLLIINYKHRFHLTNILQQGTALCLAGFSIFDK